MKVLAIVVNYRTAERTVEAVASLLDALTHLDGRVAVVDNDSQDGSRELLARTIAERGWSSRVELLCSPVNGGFGYGNNLAIRRTYDAEDAPEFFFMLNPDAVAEPDTIAALLEFMGETPDCGIAGSRIFGFDGERHVSAFRFPSPLGELEAGLKLGLATRVLRPWVVAPRPRHATGEVDWVAGASFMVRRTVFDRVGLFDEKFFLYFEEVDLSLRAKAQGLKTFYVHESRVSHEGAVATGLNDTNQPVPPYWFDSRKRFFAKHHGTTTLLAANVCFTVGFLLFRVRRRIQQKPDRDPPNLLFDFIRHNLPTLPAAPQAGAAALVQ